MRTAHTVIWKRRSVMQSSCLKRRRIRNLRSWLVMYTISRWKITWKLWTGTRMQNGWDISELHSIWDVFIIMDYSVPREMEERLWNISRRQERTVYRKQKVISRILRNWRVKISRRPLRNGKERFRQEVNLQQLRSQWWNNSRFSI